MNIVIGVDGTPRPAPPSQVFDPQIGSAARHIGDDDAAVAGAMVVLKAHDARRLDVEAAGQGIDGARRTVTDVGEVLARAFRLTA